MTTRTREYIALTITLGALLSLALPARAMGRISVKKYSEVKGEKILLGEVADFTNMGDDEAKDLAERSLGPAPKPDAEVRLARRQVETRLYNAGLELKNFEIIIPDAVTFKRKATYVTGQQLVDFTRDFLEQNIVWNGDAVKVTAKRMPEKMVLPFGEVTMEGILDSRPNQFGAKNFRVDVYLDGRKVRTQSMASFIEIYGDVVVAANPIPAGAIITESDVELKEALLDKMKAGAIGGVEDAVGKKARHNINKGEPLIRTSLDVQPDVKLNDIVTIVITGDGFSITAKGKALEKGFKGDLIKVLATGSRKVLEGVIIDSRTVEIVSK